MNAEGRALERARQVWRVAQPTTEDAAAALRRVRARRALRSRAAPRRLVMAVVMLLAMGSALAWAASHGAGTPWPGSTTSAERLERGAQRAEKSLSGAAHRATPAEPMPAADAPLAEALPSPLESAAPKASAAAPARAQPSPAPAPSWGDVDRALAQRDEPGAKRALAGLASGGDGATRARAWLGLAQLAAGRGDCAEVTRHVGAIEREPAAPDEVRRMAQRLASNCKPSP